MTSASALRRSTLCLALGLCFASAVHAQSNAAGAIFGQAGSGDTITVENPAIGMSRTIQAGDDGAYRFSQLAPGTYRVVRTAADGSTSTKEVSVSVGTGSNVSFGGDSADGATNLDAVTVVGSASVNPIDVSSVESATVLTEAVVDRIPVGRSVTGVTLLAPGTTMGDGRLGGDKPLASFGGASVAENVYYINGFNVTNIVSGTAFNEVPFEATAEAQVKTGGYGAEFGRSLGGVVNVITKRGTNEWKFGGNLIYEPDEGRTTDMIPFKADERWLAIPAPVSHAESKTWNLYASGPIIKDRLFIYALGQITEQESRASTNPTDYLSKSNDAPQGLVKLDWNINDANTLELTGFRDRSERAASTYRSDALVGTVVAHRGGDNYIARWTSYLSDSFTLSALYGVGKYSRYDAPDPLGVRDDCPVVQDVRTATRRNLGCWAQSNWVPEGTGDKRTAWRIDGEWAIGDHTLRFGMDNEEFKSTDGLMRSGPEHTSYVLSNLAAGGKLANGYVNNTGGTLAVVSARHIENGGAFLTKNSAWYLEDNWHVSDDFVAYLGVRNESFENLNDAGDPFIKIDNTWAPRLGFSWDVKGDSSFKVFGNAGRYYIPVYSNTNVRLSGAELDYTDYYAWGGAFENDAASRPVLGDRLGERRVSSDGSTPDPRTVVDPNITPLYQDEMILGFQAQLTESWTAGLRAIRRRMKAGMDDYCSYDFPYAWAIGDGGYSEEDAGAIASTVSHCFLMNPGQDLTANVDFGDGTLTEVTIPKEALGIPEPVRKYDALDFFFERAWDGKWFLQGSYTWARNIGNTEGYVKSDIGQDDAGITQDFDFPGLMEGSYGYLPNDRRHSLKVFGAYQLDEEFRLGANFIAQSGRPINCFGYYDGTSDPEAIGYGAASFYCDRELTPRGTRGRLPWTHELGLQLTYEPKWATGLRASVDVFNVLDSRRVTSVQEVGETGAGSPSPFYLQPLSVQAPRSLRLTLEYDF
jgi:hypothetical protein